MANEGFSLEVENIPSNINTPMALEQWLANEFKYVMEVNHDDWQSPEETIRSKKGDCEDFAILASRVLALWGREGQMIIIHFRGLNIAHAICIWKEENGLYSFLSNRKLHRTGERSIRNAISKYYPDWKSITFIDEKNRRVRMLMNKDR